SIEDSSVPILEPETCLEDSSETAPKNSLASEDSHVPLNPSSRVKLNHPVDQVLGNVTEPMRTQRQMRNQVNQFSQ
ncbi:hypothetical protein U1Q18_050021, partial [Sarracenia purpurea var. burkii]